MAINQLNLPHKDVAVCTNAEYLDIATNQDGEVGRLYFNSGSDVLYQGNADGSLSRVTPGAEGSVFCLFAEESGTVGQGFEWAFGNGDDTPSNNGIVLPFDCELIAMSLNVQTNNATVRVSINGNNSLSAYQVVASAPGSFQNFTTPLAMNAGDRFNFVTIAISGAPASGRVAAWIRIL